jgi:transcriptional regulator with XRE-family HTH domain
MLRVKELREDRGWSQEHLAHVAGVRTATVSDLERKEVGQLGTLLKIAKALDKHVIDLFDDDRDDPAMRDLINRVRALDAGARVGLDALLPKKPDSPE